MGIQGLIPFLKNSTRITNIRNFSGQTVAVDAYCWLHKGAFGCADKLALGKPTDFFVVYCIKRVNTLLNYGIKPVLVFDGQRLPSKAETEAKRRENRQKNLKNAKIFLQEGKTREARECFQRCVDVTPEMAHQLILACKEMGVDCVVAPYEADAQLAYLNLAGIARIIITEDSDLILFGCERVFFKMDSEGNGVLFEKRELKRSFGAKAIHLTFEKFRYACILSGCDYLPSLPGIGLVKALKFFSLITNPDLKWALTKIPAYLKMPRLANQVTGDYVEGFIRANNTFLYQLVFCPLKKKLVPLNPYPPDLDTDTEALDYAGKYFDNDLALGIATARINYQTKKAFSSALTFGQNDGPPLYKPKFKFQSIWSQNYTPNSSVTSVSPPPPISTSTEGKTMVIARVLAPKADVRPKKRPLRVQNENDGHFEMENEEIMKLYSSPGDGATKRRKMDPDSEQKPTTSEKINLTESSPPPKEALDDDSGIDASQETAATPKRNVFRVDNNESREKRTPRLVTSRFFPITPTTTRSGGGGSRNSSDSVETDEESTSPKKSSVFDEIDREGDSKTSLKRPDNGSTSSKKSSVFEEIDQDLDTETSRNIDKESSRSKERSPSPETRVETESRGQKPIFDKTQQQKLDEITTKMNKFAWKPKENGVGGKVRATMASLSSFKPPQIVGKTVAQVVNDNEEGFRAKDIPVVAIKAKAPTTVTVKCHEKMLKGGSCRTVGLSKKQKPRPNSSSTTSTTTMTTTTRQLRLTDMLNNYRYQK